MSDSEKVPIAVTCIDCDTLFVVEWYPNALYLHECPSCGALNQQLPGSVAPAAWHPVVEPLA